MQQIRRKEIMLARANQKSGSSQQDVDGFWLTRDLIDSNGILTTSIFRFSSSN